MVKLFEEEIHIMQLFYANQSIRNVRDISNATYDRPIPSIGTISNIISKSPVFGIVGCIATECLFVCIFCMQIYSFTPILMKFRTLDLQNKKKITVYLNFT
jgi:hypothetical protein